MSNAKLGIISLLPTPAISANQSSRAVSTATITLSVSSAGPGTTSTLPTTNATSATSLAVRCVPRPPLAPVSPVIPSITLWPTVAISVATEFLTVTSVTSLTVFPVMLDTLSRPQHYVKSAHPPWTDAVDAPIPRPVSNA